MEIAVFYLLLYGVSTFQCPLYGFIYETTCRWLVQKSPASVAGPRCQSGRISRPSSTCAAKLGPMTLQPKMSPAARRTTCAVRARQMQQQRRSGRTGRYRDGTPGSTNNGDCAAMPTAPTAIDATIAQRRPGLHCAARSVLAPFKRRERKWKSLGFHQEII